LNSICESKNGKGYGHSDSFDYYKSLCQQF